MTRLAITPQSQRFRANPTLHRCRSNVIHHQPSASPSSSRASSSQVAFATSGRKESAGLAAPGRSTPPAGVSRYNLMPWVCGTRVMPRVCGTRVRQGGSAWHVRSTLPASVSDCLTTQPYALGCLGLVAHEVRFVSRARKKNETPRPNSGLQQPTLDTKHSLRQQIILFSLQRTLFPALVVEHPVPEFAALSSPLF